MVDWRCTSFNTFDVKIVHSMKIEESEEQTWRAKRASSEARALLKIF
jgi:hypothetical protein